MGRKNWESEKIFNRLRTNKTRKTYWENIGELQKRPNQEVFERAYALANSENENEKIIGINVLAQLGYNPRFNQKESIDLYFQLVECEKSALVLQSVLMAIAHNNGNLSKAQIQKLVKFKMHKSSNVRLALALALSGVKNKLAIANEIELSEDENVAVRDWATFSIATQIESSDKRIMDALWKRIDDKDRGVKYEAIAGLAKRKDPKIKSVLIEELKTIDNHGSLLLDSIVDFGDKEFIVLLENQIKLNKRAKLINEKWLSQCIEKLKETESKI